MADSDKKLANVTRNIGAFPDFPKKGILFRDVFSLVKNPSAFKDLTDLLLLAIQQNCPDVQCIVGLESRGFLFGTILAQHLNLPFVPVRKKGKLPGELLSQTYQLEYGSDTFEIQKASLQTGQKVLMIDDLLATGGSMKAACDLVEQTGAVVSLCLVVIEMNDLNGRSLVGRPCKSIISY